METMQHAKTSNRYAKCIENSKRMRFDIDRDIIRGRKFDFTKKFLPDGLSHVDRLTFLAEGEHRPRRAFHRCESGRGKPRAFIG
jgi:hypothetical protein